MCNNVHVTETKTGVQSIMPSLEKIFVLGLRIWSLDRLQIANVPLQHQHARIARDPTYSYHTSTIHSH